MNKEHRCLFCTVDVEVKRFMTTVCVVSNSGIIGDREVEVTECSRVTIWPVVPAYTCRRRGCEGVGQCKWTASSTQPPEVGEEVQRDWVDDWLQGHHARLAENQVHDSQKTTARVVLLCMILAASIILGAALSSM